MTSFRALVGVAVFSCVSTVARAQTVLPPVSNALAPDVTPPPGVDVWFERSRYQTFDKAAAYFTTEPGAYVVVVRVTPRGTLEVLYPSSPAAQMAYRPTPEARSELRFRNDGAEGIGEISAIASAKPFDFSRVAAGAKWNGRRLSHPRPGAQGSLAAGFFDDISGGVGSRYGIASATYGVGMDGAGYADAMSTNPTAQSSMIATSRACRALASQPLSNDPACVAAFMARSDPKPRPGGRGRAGGATVPPPPAN